MPLGDAICTKSGTSLSGLLQQWRLHTSASSTFRVRQVRGRLGRLGQTVRNHHLTRPLRKCSNQKFIHTAKHVQIQDRFTEFPKAIYTAKHVQIRGRYIQTSFSKEKQLKWSPIVITSQQEDRTIEGPFFAPQYTKPSDPTPDSICGDACSRQQSDSEKRKENRRKLIAEKASKHKRDKFYISRILKEGGHTYDWQTPLELLNKHSPERYVDLVTVQKFRPWSYREIRQIRADCIPKPPVWSIHTFWLYVEELTRSSVDHLVGRQLYGKEGSHTTAVSKILKEVFKAPGTREFLSPGAFNAAISFFCHKSQEISQAVALFEYMEWLRMEIPTETMNIMLLSSAMHKDLHTFTKILRKCTARGIVPNALSWTALLRALFSIDVKRVVIQYMQDKKMLEDTRIMREVVSCIVRDEIKMHLDNDLDATSYLDSMKTRFGPKWLSVSVGNIILSEIGLRKPATEAVGLLHIMMERGMVANEVTLNTLLLLCKRERDHLLALRVLRLLHVETGVRIDGRTFAHLFTQAWRSRLYNFARVVWRTACIRGVLTFETLQFVRRSLLYQKSNMPSNEPGSWTRIWNESAGEVILGIRPVHNLDNPPPTSPAMKATMMEREDLKNLIDDDLATAGRYRLVDDFLDLLTNALKLDQTWRESGAWKGESSKWKRKMAITVRVSKIASVPN